MFLPSCLFSSPMLISHTLLRRIPFTAILIKFIIFSKVIGTMVGQQQLSLIHRMALSSPSRDVIVYLNGMAYNITSFLAHHPGGSMVLKMANGQDIGEYLAGHKFLVGMCHQHHNAFEVLMRYEMPTSSMNNGDISANFLAPTTTTSSSIRTTTTQQIPPLVQQSSKGAQPPWTKNKNAQQQQSLSSSSPSPQQFGSTFIRPAAQHVPPADIHLGRQPYWQTGQQRQQQQQQFWQPQPQRMPPPEMVFFPGSALWLWQQQQQQQQFIQQQSVTQMPFSTVAKRGRRRRQFKPSFSLPMLT